MVLCTLLNSVYVLYIVYLYGVSVREKSNIYVMERKYDNFHDKNVQFLSECWEKNSNSQFEYNEARKYKNCLLKLPIR